MKNDFKSALVKSSALHIGIIVALVIGNWLKPSTPQVMEVTLNAPVKPEQKAVEAVSVDNKAVEKRINELKKQEADKKAAEAKRIRDLERRAANAKKKREEEARRIAKLEKERVRKEREKKKAEAAARAAKKKQQAEQKKAAEAKKKAEALAKKRKAEEERLKKAEAKRKADAEAARQKALAEKMMQEQLAAEAAARSRAKQAQILTEVEKYQALIVSKIKNNFYGDKTTMSGKECKVNMKLAFNGLVTSVNVLGGHKGLCDATVRAIRKAEQFEFPKDKDVVAKLRDINLTYKPEF
ncbi:cell envelope integrity inner membrane protein TolA [Pseudoalteromonas sp. P1-9]|uniref:cell envelope integrity protein TolA n=1 Tax=Pseudoalteromonas sp. P1-9 TaxID=1710354 RepID=UPI0006D639FA|nr:cell envelope integrity protein TolA [Pseudoalteromonas sp. P1-9]KPV97729.1 cell envelope integrity inner membrane protein TolA [Pseudoalteromonas sp. P1-9]